MLQKYRFDVDLILAAQLGMLEMRIWTVKNLNIRDYL